jgi:NAD(P)-dependent dehydrogenase (short-subunit alcohol dehydrogenase family)
MLLSGKLVIITGAAQGVGHATAQAFASEGATVILVDGKTSFHEAASALNTKFPQVPAHSSFICDVSSGEQVDKLISKIKFHYAGRTPTLVVNNAGIMIDKLLLDVTESDFEKIIDVNLKSVFLLTKAVAS